MNVLIVNCSNTYNLATDKMSHFYRNSTVINAPSKPTPMDYSIADKIYASAIFSWDLPYLREVSQESEFWDKPLVIGGPAVTHNSTKLQSLTNATIKFEHEAEHVDGNFPMGWTSRGCIRSCPWCIVPSIEGNFMNEYENVAYAPLILDNNFLACSDLHIEKVLKLYSGKKVDWNQGLDARLYSPEFRNLVSKYKVRPIVWRFAYDSGGVGRYVQRAIEDLSIAGVSYNRIRVYLLFNYNESLDEARHRAEEIIAWGASPWPMSYKPLDWEKRGPYISPHSSWDKREITNFRRFYSRGQLWKSMNYEDYNYKYKKPLGQKEQPTFL
tara:strand:- start:8 stop:985 length:978 start_codon:yes stop_codon:yes gene_type:complete